MPSRTPIETDYPRRGPAVSLRSGLIHATADELNRAVESCERAAEYGGIVVISGLILEVVLAIRHVAPDSFESIWGPVLADSLVALGVAAELLFSKMGSTRQRELQRRSDENLAQAELELARLRAKIAPRALTEEQYKKLQTLKGQVAAVTITSTSDFEATRFAEQIAHPLMSVGIQVRIYPPRVGLMWREIYIVIPEAVADFRTVPLLNSFRNAGLSVGCGVRGAGQMPDLPHETPIIMVGEKANPHDQPPYVSGLHAPMQVSEGDAE